VGENVPGDIECPMDWDYLCDKFRDCASLAAVPPSAERIGAAQDLVRRLEALPDATELLRVLS
jgi:hypothetical protein